jgi:ACT domain-containing protein
MVATAGETHTTVAGITVGITAGMVAGMVATVLLRITTVGTIQDIMEMEGTIDRTVAIDMAGAEMDMLLIMEGITLMEVEDTMGQIDIIEQQIAHASE